MEKPRILTKSTLLSAPGRNCDAGMRKRLLPKPEAAGAGEPGISRKEKESRRMREAAA